MWNYFTKGQPGYTRFKEVLKDAGINLLNNNTKKERRQWDITNLFYRIPTDWYSLVISSIDSKPIDTMDILYDRISILEKEIVELKQILGMNISGDQSNLRQIMEGTYSEDDDDKIPVLRRDLNSYKLTRKKYFIKTFKGEVKKLWSHFSPENDDVDKMDTMLEHITHHSSQLDKNNNLLSIIVSNFQKCFDSKDKEGKIQFGSILAAVYPSYEMLKIITKRDFDRSLLTIFNYHNKNIGSGLPVPINSTCERNREFKINIVKELVEYCYDHCKRTAKVRKVKNWNKPIPLLYRTMSKKKLRNNFITYRLHKLQQKITKSVDEAIIPEYIALSNSDLYKFIKIICPSRIKSLGALDVISETAGRHNFNSIIATMNSLAIKFPSLSDLATKISKFTKTIEEYIKTDFVSAMHLKSGAGGLKCDCTAHCSYYAFGKRDENEDFNENIQLCGHVHSQCCTECEQIKNYENYLMELIKELSLMNETADTTKFLNQIQYEIDLFNKYVGHKVRLCHEDARRTRNEERCIEDSSLIMVQADFAMKWLPFKYRESMNDWFGKKGTSFLMIYFIY